jgi:L-rhamnose isomerase
MVIMLFVRCLTDLSIRALEAEGDFSQRLALQEDLKAMPSAAVWDYYCMQKGVPVGVAYMDVIKDYEKKVMSLRGG